VKVIATNRKAQHEYNILDTYEAGIVLSGSEVKSIRQGEVSLSDAYGEVRNGEVFIINLHITPYKCTTHLHLNPKRTRKLLLTAKEIKRLYGTVQQRGHTLVPLKIYFSERGLAKLTIGVCRRKRIYDKKKKIMQKEVERSIAQIRKTSR
jgi:SsrA-binding protein